MNKPLARQPRKTQNTRKPKWPRIEHKSNADILRVPSAFHPWLLPLLSCRSCISWFNPARRSYSAIRLPLVQKPPDSGNSWVRSGFVLGASWVRRGSTLGPSWPQKWPKEGEILDVRNKKKNLVPSARIGTSGCRPPHRPRVGGRRLRPRSFRGRAISTRLNPCQLAWPVKQIVGHGDQTAGNLLHP
jgi:hypothetical protein